MSDPERLRRNRAWLALALWIGLIAVLGMPPFSASNTRGWLRILIFHFIPGLSDEDLDALHFAVRKSMHVALYFGLGALAFRAFRLQLQESARRQAAAIGLALCVVVAAADEMRQSFLPSRTASVRDVGIDSVGASCGTLLFLAWFDPRRRGAS